MTYFMLLTVKQSLELTLFYRQDLKLLAMFRYYVWATHFL